MNRLPSKRLGRPAGVAAAWAAAAFGVFGACTTENPQENYGMVKAPGSGGNVPSSGGSGSRGGSLGSGAEGGDDTNAGSGGTGSGGTGSVGDRKSVV